MWARYVCAALLLPLALSRHDDDFAFDNNEEFQVELTANHSEIAKNGLARLWGVPDTSAYVGHLFRMEIPKEAFSGDVIAYKVRTEDGRPMPSWLAVDTKHGLVSGIPLRKDLGAHTFTVVAHARTHGLTATDSFTIEVKKSEDKPQSKYGSCHHENRLVLAILIDAAFHRISPRQRIRALMELANFMALDGDEFWMEPYKAESTRAHTALMSGPGDVKRRRGPATTAIYLNVGCGEKLWPRHKVLVGGIREQARDGTIPHLLRLPVLGWRLVAIKPTPRPKRNSPIDMSSGDYDFSKGEGDDADDDDDYSGFGDEDYGEDDDYTGQIDVGAAPDTDHKVKITEYSETASEASNVNFSKEPPPVNPRLLEEEFRIATIPESAELPTEPETQTVIIRASNELPTMSSPIPSPVETEPTEPSTTSSTTTSTTTSTTSTTTTTTTPAPPPPPPTTQSTTTEPVITVPNTMPAVTTTPEPTTTEEVTKQDVIDIMTSTDQSSTIVGRTTETVTFPVPPARPAPPVPVNQPPVLKNHMKKLAIKAGKAFRYIIPANLFWDPEEGGNLTYRMSEPDRAPLAPDSWVQFDPALREVYGLYIIPANLFWDPEEGGNLTYRMSEPDRAPLAPDSWVQFDPALREIYGLYIIPANLFWDPEEGGNLTYRMSETDRAPLAPDSWVQFDPALREVYGLPLESHVSRWNFIVEAQDSEGLVASGPLDIWVQQHEKIRTINHRFTLQFEPLKDYPNAIDWQIRALEGIVNLFRDTDMDHLTVLNATAAGDAYEFVWSNDTLPKDPDCPVDDINRLMKIMESSEGSGLPSEALSRAMSPALSVRRVSARGVGNCARPDVRPDARPDARPVNTYPPVSRNQVDHITAVVGKLLVHKVPEDTFYDPEDGDTRKLQLSLRFSDRSPLPPTHWLQFDARNQEFYGLPAAADEGSVHYQLIAEDSTKKSAYDSLIVEVAKAPTIRPTVEFQMTMDPSPNLVNSAANKRKVVEKLAALFGQKETDNIRIQSITDNPTTIIWYNTSLPMDRCPKREIEELRRMIIVDDRGAGGGNLREHVDQIFDKDLKVMSIRLIPLGLCAEQGTKTAKAPPPPTANVLNKAGGGEYSDYLLTFVIPAIVIVCMILVAGVIAAILYRRRRTGKMSVGDEEERQAFRSKGIPVIFQDELEERAEPEPADKSPVIMREEKPPLLPPAPDYRHDDAPYRPPPPFAASRTPPRPKATPTYRKPPPYVPP